MNDAIVPGPVTHVPLTHANVWPVGDELVVTWRGGGDVTVFVSSDPDDAGVDARAPEAPGQAVVERGEERVYVHLFDPGRGFTVVAARRLDMDGPSNFRDLGGYPTVDGATTRWGQVFRSDRLDGLTGDDHRRFERLGVTAVFDLRSAHEVANAPDRLPSSIRHVHLPMSSDTNQQRTIFERISVGELTKYDENDMADGYLRMLDAFGDHFAEVVEAVASGEPVVFHCTAGKDRTGLAAMVLLGLAGVADPHVLDDYELTNRYRPESHDGATARGTPFESLLAERGLDPTDFETLWQAPRPVMRRVVDGVRERWGDPRGYVEAVGVDPSSADAARRHLRAER